MNDFLDFAVWAIYVALLIWAAAAMSRQVNRHYDRQRDVR